MAKVEAEKLKKIEIGYLNKIGMFRNGYHSRAISWNNGKTSVMVEVFPAEEYEDCKFILRFSYHSVDRYENSKYFNYDVPVVVTPCHFGGERYWYLCPMRNSQGGFCGERVGILYLLNDYFGCRHCHNLTYESQNLGGMWKAGGKHLSLLELQRIEKTFTHKRYKGKYTKRYWRFMKQEAKTLRGFFGAARILDERAAKRKKH